MSARPFSPVPLSGLSGTEGFGSSATAVLVVRAQHISIGDPVLQTLNMDRWAARALLLALAAVACPLAARAWGPGAVAPRCRRRPPPRRCRRRPLRRTPPPAAAPETPPPAPPEAAATCRRRRPSRRRPQVGRPPPRRRRPRRGNRKRRRSSSSPRASRLRRPRLSAAVGMGAASTRSASTTGRARHSDVRQRARDRGRGVWLRSRRLRVGGGGRHGNQNPVDRLALDAFGVIRPGAWYRPADVSLSAAGVARAGRRARAWGSSATGEARCRARGS